MFLILITQTAISEDEKTVRRTGYAADGQLWVSKVLLELVNLEKDTKHTVRLGIKAEDAKEEEGLRDKTLQVIERLKEVRIEITVLYRLKLNFFSPSLIKNMQQMVLNFC